MGKKEDRIMVFVKVADEHVIEVEELLCRIPQPHNYFFCILPLETEFLTREQVERLIREVPEGEKTT